MSTIAHVIYPTDDREKENSNSDTVRLRVLLDELDVLLGLQQQLDHLLHG
jgi:hypothetical protein